LEEREGFDVNLMYHVMQIFKILTIASCKNIYVLHIGVVFNTKGVSRATQTSIKNLHHGIKGFVKIEQEAIAR
jgi:hypothetical protein